MHRPEEYRRALFGLGAGMKKIALALALSISSAGASLAADMALKARPMLPPAPVYSWAGFYVGGNVGYGWGNADTDFNAAPTVVTEINNPPIVAVNLPGFVGSQTVKPEGVIGGGQIGYNWQFVPNWVAGVEADLQGSAQKASTSFVNPFSFTVPGGAGSALVAGTAVTDYEAKISWFGTVRGRFGYAWDRVLLYATGGLAYGEVQMRGTRTVSGIVLGLPLSPTTTALGHSQINPGWTVGAGVEAALVGNWTWKAEYLYVDLGSLDDPDAPAPALTSVTGGQTLTRTRFTDNIVRVGLNYKFH
jgi:outer membrane immunogenic protein